MNPRPRRRGFTVRELQDEAEADAINHVYVRCGMVPAPTDIIWKNHRDLGSVDYLIAVRDDDGSVVGTVTGVDHKRLFDDPENGSSLWTLAVDPTTSLPGVGAGLTRALAAIYRDRGLSYMDLSVTHDNAAAIALYEKLGFQRVPVMAVKRKNAINEPLFTHPPETVDDLNPYARIIADEAMRRGIWVEVLDAGAGEMRLSHGGRTVVTRESLSEFTSAVAMSRCDDKRQTRRIVGDVGINGAEGAGWPPSTRKTTNSSPRSATSWSSRREANRARASRSASTAPTNSTAHWPGPVSSIPRCSSSSAPMATTSGWW